MKRGDVVVARFPHPSGVRGKKRPAVVVQADSYAGTISTVLAAEVTTNMLASDPACLLIDVSTPEGKATGLLRDSVVSCLVLVTVYQDGIGRVLESLSPPMQSRLDSCLKAALGLP